MHGDTITPLFSNIADFSSRTRAQELFGAVLDRHGVPHDLSSFVRTKKVDMFVWKAEIVGFRLNHVSPHNEARQPVELTALRTLREEALKALRAICIEWGRTSEIARIEPVGELFPRLCYKAACQDAMDTLRHYPH